MQSLHTSEVFAVATLVGLSAKRSKSQILNKPVFKTKATTKTRRRKELPRLTAKKPSSGRQNTRIGYETYVTSTTCDSLRKLHDNTPHNVTFGVHVPSFKKRRDKIYGGPKPGTYLQPVPRPSGTVLPSIRSILAVIPTMHINGSYQLPRLLLEEPPELLRVREFTPTPTS
mmetsp:Transcript_6115/g.6667  ORF Transcript_6115/g.6667 Transcript_6115/m.6667 type:complete len:171 (-) Transcript_6115:94-606(-)